MTVCAMAWRVRQIARRIGVSVKMCSYRSLGDIASRPMMPNRVLHSKVGTIDPHRDHHIMHRLHLYGRISSQREHPEREIAIMFSMVDESQLGVVRCQWVPRHSSQRSSSDLCLAIASSARARKASQLLGPGASRAVAELPTALDAVVSEPIPYDGSEEPNQTIQYSSRAWIPENKTTKLGGSLRVSPTSPGLFHSRTRAEM